jgi:ubiquinone/menaquinone biosynthesis C-methylase UbiE
MRGVEQIPWFYDAFMTVFERAGLDRWRRWLVGGAEGLTLEVGCGTGRNLPLYPTSARVIGLEIDRAVLAAARRRAGRVPLVVGRAEALPFRDGQFDTVVSGLVFCTVRDPHAGLAEVRRVLQPGGQLRMMEHVRYDSALGRVQDLAQPVWTAIAGGCHPNRNTEANVIKAGFVIDPSTLRARNTMRRFVARPGAGKELP